MDWGTGCSRRIVAAEILAGAARLKAALRDAGFRAAGVDYFRNAGIPDGASGQPGPHRRSWEAIVVGLA
eukprot:15464842-Alexandrium_andersonii.AAC.1